MNAPLSRWALPAAAAFWVAQSIYAQSQAPASRQTTPAGLSFHYVHMPEDTHQSLGFAWKDGTSISLPGTRPSS